MKLNKFQIAIIIGILVVALVAFLDIRGVDLIGYDKYTKGDFPQSVWINHLWTAILIFLIPAVCYFVFYRKDKSEAFAIFLISFILLWTGFADVLYFWFQGKTVPLTLPWLSKNPIIGKLSLILGDYQVTRNTLYISTIAGFIIAISLAYILKKKF